MLGSFHFDQSIQGLSYGPPFPRKQAGRACRLMRNSGDQHGAKHKPHLDAVKQPQPWVLTVVSFHSQSTAMHTCAAQVVHLHSEASGKQEQAALGGSS